MIENAKELYKTRGDIINAFKKLKTDETEESEESGDDTDLDWTYGSKDELKKLRDQAMGIKSTFNLTKEGEFIKKIRPINLQIFLKDRLDGEIDNKEDALEEYVKKC